MALSRVKNWIAGEVLYAADQNAEFNNILNNALALISPLTGNLDAGSNDITALDELAFSDGAAAPSATARIRRNGALLQWLIESNHTNSVLNLLRLIGTTSGSPAAGIGSGFELYSESADENPSALLGLQGIFTDVGSGTEDSVFSILLRVAGRALDEKYRFASTAGDGFGVTFTHAVTADRTVTIPDEDVTLGGLPRGHITGLTLSNNVADATNDIDIATGKARDKDDSTDIVLSGALTKRLDATWAVGTNQGGLASGAALTDTTYHVFLIKRPDTGVVDVAFDSSATGANVEANTNAAYTKRRRIGSIIRAGGAIVGFVQDGDYFQLKVPVSEWSENVPATTAQTKTLARVPTGIKVRWKGHISLRVPATGDAMGMLVTDLATTDTAPTGHGAGIGGQVVVSADTDVGNMDGSAEVQVMTNTSAQVRARASSTTNTPSWQGIGRGWFDRRNQDD